MKNNLKALFLFSIISGILILSWFRQGYLYGGGDVGLQTYNPQRILQNAMYTWWDSAGPGAPLPQGLSAIHFQFILFLLQIIGFSPIALQATLFFVLLFLMGYGMYLFLQYKLEDRNKLYSIIGGVFYMLNPYMMIQVWHRFIHTTIVLAAALPFLALFWDKWIKEGGIRYLLFFLLASFLSVYAFGTYAFILAVWILLLLINLSSVIPWQGKMQLYKTGVRFLFGFIIWLLINAWWMIPVSQISPAVLSEQHKTEESLMTLITISAQEILPYSLQMVNPFYLFYQAELGTIYKNILFQMIPWVFVSIILFGLINSIRQKSFSMFGIFYLLALFLAKGAAPPFGNIYIFGFSNIFILGVLRNPFEKTGLILVFFSTILFTLGLKLLFDKFLKTLWFCKAGIVFIISLIFIFAWPMVLGKVIGRFDKPAFVEVPQNYKEADLWLNLQKKEGISDGKILHLPLTRAESIQYKWKYGYNGLEPSDTFFTAFPSISRGFNIFRIDEALSGLSLSFQKPQTESLTILEYLQDFNVRFIVLHKDVNWIESSLSSPEDIEEFLDKQEFLTNKKIFGDLIVYRLGDQYFKPRITLEHYVSVFYPGEGKLSFYPYLVKDKDSKLISPVEAQEDLDKITKSSTFIFPKSNFIYGISSASASPLERLASIKPMLQQVGMIQSLNLVNNIISLSTMLSNISQNQIPSALSLLENYEKGMKQIFPIGIQINKFTLNGEESLLSGVFRMHLTYLYSLQAKLLGEEKQKAQALVQALDKYLIELNLKPRFPLSNNTESQVFKYNVPIKGEYQLAMVDSLSAALYPENLSQATFLINGNQILLKSKTDRNILIFGNLELEQGEVEITYPMMLSSNLALSDNKTDISYVEIPIKETKGGNLYRLSGSVKVNQGTGFNVFFYENENPNPSFRESLQLTPQLGWQNLQMNFQTKPTTTAAKIVITDVPSMSIRDIKVQKLLTNTLLLINKGNQQNLPTELEEAVQFKRISPVSYEGEIKLLKPGILFFKETFHPGWKLIIKDEKGTKNIKSHYLANLYANGWYIDQPGEYKFKIVFQPQNTFSTGILFSGLGILGIAGYSILVKKMKKKNEEI